MVLNVLLAHKLSSNALLWCTVIRLMVVTQVTNPGRYQRSIGLVHIPLRVQQLPLLLTQTSCDGNQVLTSVSYVSHDGTDVSDVGHDADGMCSMCVQLLFFLKARAVYINHIGMTGMTKYMCVCVYVCRCAE